MNSTTIKSNTNNNSNGGLQIRESLQRGIYVEGMTEEIIEDAEHGMHLLRMGSRNRQVSFT